MYSIILFDLDGTLTDSKPGITKCVQYALAKLGINEPDTNRLTPFIGPPLLHSFKKYYQLNDEQAAAALGYYRERFADVGMFENEVYPGIPDLLNKLKNQGRRLVVATSKPTVFSIKILEHFGLIAYFDEVVGSNLDGSRIEKAEVIAFALSGLADVNRESIIMVGDREHDILGAKANSLDVIAVGYGYGTPEELRQAGPNRIVGTVDELAAVLLD